MRDLLAEVRHRAWAAAAVVGTLAITCATLRLGASAALAIMATGAILMWISEEEQRVLAAMTPGGDPMPAPELPPAPATPPVLLQAPSMESGSAVRIREWSNPFPALQTARRERLEGRRTGGRRA